MTRDIYLGPGPFNEEPKPQVMGVYDVGIQARGWIPEEQTIADPAPAESNESKQS